MLEDDRHVLCLKKAIDVFPAGCVCEDNLECSFCRYVVAVAQQQRDEHLRECSRGEKNRFEYAVFAIAVFEDMQVDEMRGMFRS